MIAGSKRALEKTKYYPIYHKEASYGCLFPLNLNLYKYVMIIQGYYTIGINTMKKLP